MTEIRRTPAQDKAIGTIDRSACVRAGAGTGKTFVLVGRYMELLKRRRVESVREIAALTYTEKAAKEMKDRIRRECLAEEERASGDGVRWWRRQRIDLETAHVGTLHGFCSSLLAEYPVEAGVDPQFVLLDEVAQLILGERAADDVLRRELDANTPGVLELCRAAGLSGVRDTLDAMTSHRVEADRAVATLEASNDADALAAVKTTLDRLQAEFLAQALTEVESSGLLDVLRSNRGSDATDLAEARRRDVLRLAGEIAGAKAPERRVALAGELRDALATLAGGSKKKWDEAALVAVKDAFKRLRAMLDEVPGGEFGRSPGEADAAALAYARTLTKLYREVVAAYAQAKVAGGYLDFEDLLIRAHALLSGNEGVRRRVRERVRFLLVDELQDSALIDREILMLLVRDEGKAERVEPGRLFVVGDDKQSIYRFRGAEVTVFREFADLLKGQGELVDLDVNFRTVPRGVAFANDFFGRLLGRAETKCPWENRYFDLSAKRTEDTPFLEVLIPEPDDEEKAAEARDREARMVASRIREMVDGKEKLVWDADAKAFRAVKRGDVAVLFRAMTGVGAWERALRDAGVPYYILGGSGFYRAQEILDLLTALKTIERPRDAVALVGTLRSPLFGISDETLFFMRRRGPVARGLDEAESVENITDDQRRGLVTARTVLRDLAAIKNRVSISRLVEELLRRTGYDALLLAQYMGRQKLANVEKLVDLARTFEARGLFTLDDFLRYIEEFVSVEARESERAAEEESSDVVRLMSVHRAKGLEFPVVFVADLAHEPRRGSAKAAFDRSLGVVVSAGDDEDETPVLYDLMRREAKLRDEAEDLRVLYVALTRARDYLVLSGALPRGRVPGGSWLARLAGAYELRGDDGTIAPEIVFGKDAYRAPVRTTVPVVPPEEAKERHHAAWKVVRRLDRLVERAELVRRVPDFEGRHRIEPLALDLAAKRRFVASEFPEYHYCAQRYYLTHVLGILPSNLGTVSAEGRPDGRVIGTLVHRALTVWDFRKDTLDAVIGSVLTGSGLAGTDSGRRSGAEVKRMILAGLGGGLFADISAAAERRSEYSVAARVSDFVVEGMLDSVHRGVDGTWEVVDYKTDHVDAGGVSALVAHYELQIACYALALAKSGLVVSRASLLFVRAGKQHSWTCDPARMAVWEKRLAAVVRKIRGGDFEARHEGTCRCAHGWTCGRETEGGKDLELI